MVVGKAGARAGLLLAGLSLSGLAEAAPRVAVAHAPRTMTVPVSDGLVIDPSAPNEAYRPGQGGARGLVVSVLHDDAPGCQRAFSDMVAQGGGVPAGQATFGNSWYSDLLRDPYGDPNVGPFFACTPWEGGVLLLMWFWEGPAAPIDGQFLKETASRVGVAAQKQTVAGRSGRSGSSGSGGPGWIGGNGFVSDPTVSFLLGGLKAGGYLDPARTGGVPWTVAATSEVSIVGGGKLPLALSGRLHLGGSRFGGIAFGVEAMIGVGAWITTDIGASLTGGVQWEASGSKIPGAWMFPVEAALWVDFAGYVRFKPYARMSFSLTDNVRRRGSPLLPFADEFEIGAQLWFGEEDVGDDDLKGKFFLGANYRELMGTGAVFATIGFGAHNDPD